MADRTEHKKLLNISPDKIRENPENPRLVFRQEEMESLLVSIDEHGIQVPVTVFEAENGFYHLIDGERRWRCAKKLNLRTVPAIVQDRPSELQNLLLMYNIHALREQWDYYTIASKLKKVISLFTEELGEEPNEGQLSDATGLTRGAIRRCRLLIGLPQRYENMLLQELELPKSQQRLSEDLFIEMERSLKTVTRRIPEYSENIDNIRDVLIDKYRSKVIPAVTDFRQLSKIATAIDRLGIERSIARRALNSVFNPKKKFGIRDAYKKAVEFEYDEKKAAREATALVEFIDEILEEGIRDRLDDDFLQTLATLNERLRRLLEG